MVEPVKAIVASNTAIEVFLMIHISWLIVENGNDFWCDVLM
jgi:hypothetical protein